MPDDIASTANEVYRDYVTDAVPSSGANDPAKADVRALWSVLASTLADLGALSGVVVFEDTLAHLNANLTPAANSGGVVYNDGTASNNRLYIKVGGTGTGSWTQTGILIGADVATLIAANTAAISAETTRATAAEGVNAAAVVTEATRAEAAEAANAAGIAANTAKLTTLDGAGVNASGQITLIGGGAGGQAEQPISVYDVDKGEIITAGHPRRYNQPYAAKWTVDFESAGGGVVAGVDSRGRFWTPGLALAPHAHIEAVTDPGGSPINQVFVDDGLGPARRVTMSDAHCYEPRVIGPGLIAYARGNSTPVGASQYSSPAVASFGERTATSSASGVLRIIIQYGQSLGAGSQNTTLTYRAAYTSKPPSDKILMFVGGVWTNDPGDVTFVLASGNAKIASIVSAYDTTLDSTGSYYGSTGGIELAWMLAESFGLDHTDSFLVMNGAVGGQTYEALKKGTQPYANLMTAITKAVGLAPGLGFSSTKVELLYWNQGEAQPIDTGTVYKGKLEELQTDLSTDVAAITGQSGLVPIFATQKSSPYSPRGTIGGPSEGVLAANLAGDTIYLVTPEYPFDRADGTHLRSFDYRALGAYVGKVAKRVLYDGEAWLPLYPTAAVLYGTQVEVTFHVPRGQIALDDSWVSNPGCYGVQFNDSTNSAYVVGVRLKPGTPDTLLVDLSVAPTGSSPAIGIGYYYPGTPAIFTGASGNEGRLTGIRTCIRDSDLAACPGTGRPIPNYAAHAFVAVTAAP